MSREEIFWNRVIELSKKTFKKEIFDYFVLTSRLIKVDQQEAIIYLDAEVKKKSLFPFQKQPETMQ